MDGQQCDRHPSARAQAKVLLPGGNLYFCGHCSQTLNFGTDFYIEYEAATV
jgi:predicted SprT family Zn-dependent metalloprotease